MVVYYRTLNAASSTKRCVSCSQKVCNFQSSIPCKLEANLHRQPNWWQRLPQRTQRPSLSGRDKCLRHNLPQYSGALLR
jgi:hypothetical protein